MFSGRPSVPLSIRPCVCPSVIHVVVLCFRDISSICWRIFAKLLSLVHLGTQMTWLRFWVKRSKFKVTPSRRSVQHSTLPSSATFSSFLHVLNYFRLHKQLLSFCNRIESVNYPKVCKLRQNYSGSAQHLIIHLCVCLWAKHATATGMAAKCKWSLRGSI